MRKWILGLLNAIPREHIRLAIGESGYIYIDTPGKVYDYWAERLDGTQCELTPPMTQGKYLAKGTLLKVTVANTGNAWKPWLSLIEGLGTAADVETSD